MVSSSGDEPGGGALPQQLDVDVAVIGAGVSGLYTAWRLLQADPARTVAVFEMSERIGGRLFSRALPGMPHVHAELGGMRYLPNQQPLVHGVVEELGLATRPFLVGDPRPHDGRPGSPPAGARNNLLYLRRRLMRSHELARAAGDRYFLGPHERGKTPDEILAQVMATYIPFLAGRDVSEFGEREVLGEALYRTGYWNLLAKVLSSEGYRYVRHAGGYDTNVSNANAAAALQINEFGGEVIYRTLKRGMQALPLALARACDRVSTARRGARAVWTNARLDGFARAGEGA
ncbi:MAG: FAD-dependent oxidoreductase, partial [Myxococcales bacterium]|nr:FAD-dependent oxidoreductase [Myxococcales bacterium]